MGHGGTLDPLATGVLILGVGSGTKSLGSFLDCTKSYDAVLLFGAATDTYDSEGKIVARKPYDHVTKDKVESALQQFRGKIMQRPPIFSALRVNGKRLYDYAREGKEPPVEIKERPVEVLELEMTEWMEGGSHVWHWPEREAEKEEKQVVEKVLHLNEEPVDGGEAKVREEASPENKRKRGEDVDTRSDAPSQKRPKSLPERVLKREQPAVQKEQDSKKESEPAPSNTGAQDDKQSCPAPACRIRMTVTSGFYVRSLCQDLGTAVGSTGLMASLVRTRQGDFELGKNVLAYEDLAQGEEVWGPKVEAMLKNWNAAHEGETARRRNTSSPETP